MGIGSTGNPEGRTPAATRRYFQYLLRRKKRFLLLVAVAFMGALAGVLSLARTAPSYWNIAEPLLAISTLLVAVGVWVGEGRQEWIDSLPKRLTVCFLHPTPETGEPRIALLCENAYLANGGDIRALGQSIGSQMIGGGQLAFLPDIRQRPGLIRRDARIGEYMHYEVVFQLCERPSPRAREGLEDHFAQGAALVWEREGGSRRLVWYGDARLPDDRAGDRFLLSGRIR